MLILHYDYNVNSEWVGIDGSFEMCYDKNWMLDPAIPDIVKSIDGCRQICPNVFEHDEFGMYSGNRLSGGSKTIIMAMAMPNEIFPLGNLGPNCAKALYIASINHDIQFSYRDYFFQMHPDISIKLMYLNGKVVKGRDHFPLK